MLDFKIIATIISDLENIDKSPYHFTVAEYSLELIDIINRNYVNHTNGFDYLFGDATLDADYRNVRTEVLGLEELVYFNLEWSFDELMDIFDQINNKYPTTITSFEFNNFLDNL